MVKKNIFTAEFTTNHCGNFNLLKKMAFAAKNSGADYIKMQIILQSMLPDIHIIEFKYIIEKKQVLHDLQKKLYNEGEYVDIDQIILRLMDNPTAECPQFFIKDAVLIYFIKFVSKTSN